MIKKDRSKQGFLDEDVLPLIDLINQCPKYRTRSSCSGRIVLLKLKETGKKQKAKWVYKTHKKAEAKEVFSLIQKHWVLYFLQEPAILHVNCGSLEDAEKLLKVARNVGFKMSGLISSKHFTLELRSTERIETPVISDLPFSYVACLVKEANKKLLRTKERMRKLQRSFEQDLSVDSHTRVAGGMVGK